LYYFRGIWDGARYFFQQEDLSRSQLFLSSSTRPSDSHVLEETLELGSFLNGTATVLGDDEPIGLVLRKQEWLALNEDESINGHLCRVVEGTGSFGKYKAWIDPAAGYCVRQATASKSVGDLYGGMKLPFGREPYVQFALDVKIVNDDVKVIDGLPVVLHSRMDCTERYENGSYESYYYLVTRSQFDTSPDFSKTDAFALTGIPDGTSVQLRDRDPSDHFPYVWKHGQVVRDDAESIRALNGMVDKIKKAFEGQ